MGPGPPGDASSGAWPIESPPPAPLSGPVGEGAGGAAEAAVAVAGAAPVAKETPPEDEEEEAEAEVRGGGEGGGSGPGFPLEEAAELPGGKPRGARLPPSPTWRPPDALQAAPALPSPSLSTSPYPHPGRVGGRGDGSCSPEL